MRKLLVLSFIILLLTGCNTTKSTLDVSEEEVLKDINPSDIVEINENLFIQSINDVYINPSDYRDKYVIIEGLYSKEKNNNRNYHLVIRYGPGCCIDDEKAGFQLEYDGEYPKENDWIRVIGKFKTFMESGYEGVKIEVLSLEVKKDRGKETVEGIQ